MVGRGDVGQTPGASGTPLPRPPASAWACCVHWNWVPLGQLCPGTPHVVPSHLPKLCPRHRVTSNPGPGGSCCWELRNQESQHGNELGSLGRQAWRGRALGRRCLSWGCHPAGSNQGGCEQQTPRKQESGGASPPAGCLPSTPRRHLLRQELGETTLRSGAGLCPARGRSPQGLQRQALA